MGYTICRMFWVYKNYIILFLCLFTAASFANPEPFVSQLIQAAQERTRHKVIYDGSYEAIAYPMGDISLDRGVCTDLVIRAYRTLGVDLQQLVHEDMRDHFSQYPKIWGLRKTDTNIDHRRVPNLQTFFKRHGKQLSISQDETHYKPGHLVTWILPGNLPHIGIVSDRFVNNTNRPNIIHNIGRGPVRG